jgi:hypothetical protein
VKTGK